MNPQLKIDWANEHIKKFPSVKHHFMESKPFNVGHKRRPGTNEIVYYVTYAKRIPSELALIAGDVLQNLRTALDHLVCALVHANGKEITNRHMFPISKKVPSPAKDEAEFEEKIDGMADEPKDLIRKMKTYMAGDDLLWQTHALNNRDEHRMLFVLATGRPSINLGEHIRATRKDLRGHVPDFLAGSEDEVFPLEVGKELYIDPPDVEVNQDMKVIADIALKEPPLYEGLLGDLLIKARDHVQEIISSFDKWVRPIP